MFRCRENGIEVFLVHPGGPFWVTKDEGVWTIPKGEHETEEEALDAARREFLEETGFQSNGPFVALGSIRQKSGKVVTAWAFEGDCDPKDLVSNTCEIEWPPRSKRRLTIPEVDRGAWFSLNRAATFMREEQQAFLAHLLQEIA
jgi:predicted NUDIX family NTP pyrophosphohydrolase